jgi:hypothetical protein
MVDAGRAFCGLSARSRPSFDRLFEARIPCPFGNFYSYSYASKVWMVLGSHVSRVGRFEFPVRGSQN